MLVAVSGALFLFRAGTLPLMDPDESRCAQITDEMEKSGDLLVPHLDGEVYFDKPAPFFWLTVAARKLTGNMELSGRLVASLAGIAAVLTTYAFGRRMFNATAGLLGGLILATSVEFLFIARWFRMDMPFTAAMWAAVWWFWRGECFFAADGNPAHRERGWLGFYFFCAIATLFKGPAGLVLPVLIVMVYFLLSRQTGRIKGFFNIPGIGLYLLIAAPWYVAISLREPGYAYDFFIHHNLERYAGYSFKHHWPGIIYIPIVLAGLLPWTVYLPAVFARYFPRRWRSRAERPELLMLWLTVIVIVVFFSFSGTKLPSYILPAIPPLAVLTGTLIAEWIEPAHPDRKMSVAAGAFTFTVLMILLVLTGAEIWLGCIDPWIVVPAGVGGLAVWRMAEAIRRDQRRGFVVWAFGGIIIILLFVFGHTAMRGYELLSARVLARLVPPDTVAESRFCFLPNRVPSFILYTGITKTEKLGRASSESIKRLMELMAGESRVYCFVSGTKNFEEVKKANVHPIYVLGRIADHWLITNRPAAGNKSMSPQLQESHIAPTNLATPDQNGR